MHKQTLLEAVSNGHKTTTHALHRGSKTATGWHNMVPELCFPRGARRTYKCASKIATGCHNMVPELCFPRGARRAYERARANRFLRSFMKSDADDPVIGAEDAGFFFKASTGTGAFVIAPGPAHETQCL